MNDTPSDEAEHRKHLGLEDCPCRFAWQALGRLYRVNMGHGWVRVTTEPDCPHHGTEAVRAWAKAHLGKARR